MAVEPSSLVIPPGHTEEVELTFDLRPTDLRFGDQGTPRLPLRPFEVRVVVKANDSLPGSAGWVVSGKARDVFAKLPHSIDFGESCVWPSRFPSRPFEVVSRSPLKRLTATCPGSEALVNVVRLDEAGKRFRVDVAPRETLPVGEFKFRVELTALRAEGDKLPPLGVDVLGVVVEDVEITPFTVSFGAIKAGTEPEEMVVLTSRTGTPFEVLGVEVSRTPAEDRPSRDQDDSNRVEIELVSAAAGEWRYRVKIYADKAGACQRTVYFTVRTKLGGETFRISLSVLGSVMPALSDALQKGD